MDQHTRASTESDVINYAQSITMLQMQKQINDTMGPGWMERKLPYLRAVFVESSEALEHHGWKWWKKQTMNLSQLQMELIDIWHFYLSHLLLVNGGHPEHAYSVLEVSAISEMDGVVFDGCYRSFAEMDTMQKLELIGGLAVAKRLSIGLFASVLEDVDLTWSELYRQYVGKNTLNAFRQDHGDKQGTYAKVWDNKEDNVHLVEILDQAQEKGLAEDAGLKDYVYTELKARYLDFIGRNIA